MGRELAAFPVFASAFDDVCELLADVGGVPGVRDVVWGTDAAKLDSTLYAQTGLFAFEVAFFRLLESWGVRPDHVMGHSLGEVTAAYVAGVWSLADACRVVGARARWMSDAPSGGVMAALEAAEEDVVELLAGEPVVVSGANGPTSVVVAGPADAVERVLSRFTGRVKRLRVSHAFHSPAMDPVLAGFQAEIAAVTYHVPQLPLVSNVTGKPADRKFAFATAWPPPGAQPLSVDGLYDEYATAAGFDYGPTFQGVTAAWQDGHDVYIEIEAPETLDTGGYGLHPALLDATLHSGLITPDPKAILPFVWSTVTVHRRGATRLRAHIAQSDHIAIQVADRARIAGAGLRPLGNEEGMALLDAALRGTDSLLVPVALDTSALRSATAPILRGLAGRPAAAKRSGGRSLPRRPANVSDAEWAATLAGHVRAEVAAVLGHAAAEEITDTAMFRDLGFDSLASVDLRNRLNSLTGLQLPATVAFDYPSVAALTEYLASKIAPNPHEEDTVSARFAQAIDAGQTERALELAATAAALRPMDASSPELVPLRHGTGPELVCVSAFGALSGVHQYHRLAESLGGNHAVSAFVVPGYRPGEELADSMDTLAELLTSAVRTPFVLLGHSSGGWLAHLAAERLEREGTPPAGIVLFDSYVPGSDGLNTIFPDVIKEMVRLPEGTSVSEHTRISAMGWYLRMFHGWEPNPVAAPTLFVHPTDPPLEHHRDKNWQAEWPLPRHKEAVPGNHFTMMTDGAPRTAEVVTQWISELDT